jgi:pSer/pThr/pTyr-binding forkhead associated (FHA) protein
LYCNQCGHRNPDASNFCSSCGAVLEHPAGDEPTTITLLPLDAEGETGEQDVVVDLTGLPDDAGVLVVKRGPDAGSRYLLGSDTTRVGRHPHSDIFLDDVTVSRRHADIKRTAAGDYEVSDVGSLNGTYLNRERIESAVLAHGDELQIGKFRLVFLTESMGG